jgi:hypothetical protein
MTYRGTVRGGAIVLEGEAALPEGTIVSVRAVASKSSRRVKSKRGAATSLYERLKPVIGKAKSLPPDMALNHDHYLYGVPKRSAKGRKAG